MILKILNNRNTILILSLILGLFLGNFAVILKHYTLIILVVVMVFSTTSFDFKSLKDYKFFFKSTIKSFILNYIIFGIIVLGLAYLLIDEKELLYGFIVIAATPPGVAVVPFTIIYKGNTKFSLMGLLGVYLLAIFVTPFIIASFSGGTEINTSRLIITTLELIVLPIILSRLLLLKKIFPVVEKIRGKVVNWGFALIIYTVVGLNSKAIFSDWQDLLRISSIIFTSIFILGFAHWLITKNKVDFKNRISTNLMLTIKSSGFAAGTTLAVFGERSALPAAILAVIILMYLIFSNVLYKEKNKSLSSVDK